MRKEPVIGVIVLTYNGAEELPGCIDGLLSQVGRDMRLIVVDNGSEAGERARMEASFRERIPQGLLLEAGDVRLGTRAEVSAVFVRNDRNAGYSAGNNIGARLAIESGCEAVLVMNPDVRVSSPDYVRRLSECLFADPTNVVAASAMKDLSGRDENPMRELGFFRELFLPVAMLGSLLGWRSRASTMAPATELVVEKVSGCCFLIRADFLKAIGFFDENVFLYCEEAILAKQVREAGRRIAYCPEIEAVHAHRKSAKGSSVRRQVLWSRSRRYYHAHYAGYGWIQRVALAASHRLIIAMAWLHARTERSS